MYCFFVDALHPSQQFYRELSENVGHFIHGHFGLERFGPDISAMDISATKKPKGKVSAITVNHKVWVGVCACINV